MNRSSLYFVAGALCLAGALVAAALQYRQDRDVAASAASGLAPVDETAATEHHHHP